MAKLSPDNPNYITDVTQILFFNIPDIYVGDKMNQNHSGFSQNYLKLWLKPMACGLLYHDLQVAPSEKVMVIQNIKLA